MDLADADMVRALETRDGPLGSHWRSHRDAAGACRYDFDPPRTCPWCLAEDRRIAAGRAPSPQPSR
jgi:hypothetical protein